MTRRFGFTTALSATRPIWCLLLGMLLSLKVATAQQDTSGSSTEGTETYQDFDPNAPSLPAYTAPAANQPSASKQPSTDQKHRFHFARRLNVIVPKTPLPPTQLETTCGRGKWVVYGFHPNWVSGDPWKSYQFDLLSHVAYFGYQINVKTGGPLSLGDWATTPLVDSAHAAGCKVHLTVNTVETNGYSSDMLSNPTVAQACIDSICYWVRARKADGVCVDFEDMASESDAPLFLNWITSLRTALKKDNPNAEIAIAGPAIPSTTTFTQAALYQVIDYMVVMGYEFTGSWENQPGCTSPLPSKSSSTQWSLQGSIDRYLAAEVDPSQIVMALPYYGPAWYTSSNTAATPPGTFDDYPTFSQIIKSYPGNGFVRNWDAGSQSSYYVQPHSGQYLQAWILDSASMALRYDTIKDRQLAGAGIWALSFDAGSNQLWDLLNVKFGSCDTTAIAPDQETSSGPTWATNWRWVLPWGCLIALLILVGVIWTSRKAREEILNRYLLFPLGAFVGMAILIIAYETIRDYLHCCISPMFPWLILLGTAILVLGFYVGKLWSDRKKQDQP